MLTVRCARPALAIDVRTPVAEDPGAPASVLLATTTGDGDGHVLDRVGRDGTTATVTRLGPGEPLAIDRLATRVLYRQFRGGPPSLWEATLGPRGLADRRRLLARSPFAAAAW